MNQHHRDMLWALGNKGHVTLKDEGVILGRCTKRKTKREQRRTQPTWKGQQKRKEGGTLVDNKE